MNDSDQQAAPDDRTTGDGHRLADVVDDLEDRIADEHEPVPQERTEPVDTTPADANDEAPD